MTQPTNPADKAGEPGKAAKKPAVARSLAFQLAALVLIVVSGLAGTGLAKWLRLPEAPEPKNDAPPTGPLASLFKGWEKPDLVLVVSAEQHGYLLPCGCSHPQKGGLERRYNFIQLLKERGWPVAAVDLGNVPQEKAPAELPNVQGLIKYRYAMRAMKEMNYTAVGIGEYEAAMPLFNALAEYSLNDEKPRVVSADLLDQAAKYPGMTKSWQEADPIGGAAAPRAPLLGATSVIGPTLLDAMKKKDPSLRFQATPGALDAALQEMAAQNVDLRVLLYMGSISKGADGSKPEAVACAEAYPQFPLIVALDDTDEPRAGPVYAVNPKTKAKTMIVSLGHKGKYVGVVGVFRTGKADQPFDLRYQLVEMSEDLKTPAEKEADQPILKLMEEYTKELKDNNYLGKYAQVKHPNQAAAPKDRTPKYVGTDRCADCHMSAKEIWDHTAHAHAYQTLVDAKQPSNRQYDPECIVCHTVGFGYQTGFKSEKETSKLLNVGCESCHGPGSVHANDPNDMAVRALMNPWKAPAGETPAEQARRTRRIDDACQKCHDPENDVNWTDGGFERNWPKIAHPTPPGEKQDAAEPEEPGKK